MYLYTYVFVCMCLREFVYVIVCVSVSVCEYVPVCEREKEGVLSHMQPGDSRHSLACIWFRLVMKHLCHAC